MLRKSTVGASPDAMADETRTRALSARSVYLRLLTWSFTLFNSARVFAYMPNIWSIHQQADSSQHSLLTWITLLGANVTMAGWLYEENGHKLGKAIAINLSNAVMCLLTATSIGWYRYCA